MHNWLTTANLGKYLIKQEKLVLDKLLDQIYGTELLLIGESAFANCVEHSHAIYKAILNKQVDDQLDNKIYIPAIRARQDKLPVMTESINAVYIAHAIEFSNNPHEILRESYRVLKSEGKIILTCFNIFSLWAIFKTIAKFWQKDPFGGKFYSSFKLIDWLKLLGFEDIEVRSFAYLLPISNKKYLNLNFYDKLAKKINLPFGAAFCITATKRLIPLTPVVPEKDKVRASEIIAS